MSKLGFVLSKVYLPKPMLDLACKNVDLCRQLNVILLLIKLVSAPLPAYPEFFVLEADASIRGLGAVLYYQIAFASSKLQRRITVSLTWRRM